MIKLENTDVFGWESAIRGMRNPMNSWDKSDSHWCNEDCPHVENETEPAIECNDGKFGYCIGYNDLKLMKQLKKAGSDHSKYLRMINVTCDIIAPLYWWKEYDTYKVGTVANSCSTMHKITEKEFTLDDFSHEHLGYDGLKHMEETIEIINFYRTKFTDKNLNEWNELKSKKDMWWQIIQLLPSSYNQKRTVQLNYAVLLNIYHARKNHKLDEWHEFCNWCKTLPYFKEICLED